MSLFIQHTITDIRAGRETWRVFTSLCAVAFTVAVTLQLV